MSLTKSFWDFPSLIDPGLLNYSPSGLTVLEDKEGVRVRCHVPDMNPDEISIEYDQGYLKIHAEKQEEKTGEKYYRKSQNVFSYALHVPGNIDLEIEPKASLKKGVLDILFQKLPEQPRGKPVKIVAEEG